jgi:hypothetical protein
MPKISIVEHHPPPRIGQFLETLIAEDRPPLTAGAHPIALLETLIAKDRPPLTAGAHPIALLETLIAKDRPPLTAGAHPIALLETLIAEDRPPLTAGAHPIAPLKVHISNLDGHLIRLTLRTGRVPEQFQNAKELSLRIDMHHTQDGSTLMDQVPLTGYRRKLSPWGSIHWAFTRRHL